MDAIHTARRIEATTIDQLKPELFDGTGEMTGEPVHDNTRRAGLAMMAVRAYAEACKENDPETAIKDLMGDLRHLCDALDYELVCLDALGDRYYVEEVTGQGD